MRRGLLALVLLSAPAWADRPDTPGSKAPAPLFGPTDTVETYGSAGGRFLLHFARTGPNAVPTKDADASGVPDFVELAADTYDEVRAYYTELGFRDPLADGKETVTDLPPGETYDDGGDDRFDVYFVDFGGHADGAFRAELCLISSPAKCSGYMVQENDFVGSGYPSQRFGERILASHEYFHAVQAAYHNEPGAVILEATAVWATEAFDPTLDDLDVFAAGYLDRPERSLDQEPTGPVDEFTYGASIFFEFLSERFGPDIIRALWEAVELAGDGKSGAFWVPALDGLLIAGHDSDFGSAFQEFAEWNRLTADRADPARSYAHGASYSLVATKAVDLPFQDNLVRMFHASARYFAFAPVGRAAVTAALVLPDGADASHLTLSLSLRKGHHIDSPVALPYGDVPVVVDASAADEVIALLVSTATDGESQKPGLCLGSPDEVEACRVALGDSTLAPPDPIEPEPSEGDDIAAGADDLGPSADATSGDDDSGDTSTGGDTSGAVTSQAGTGPASSGCSAGASPAPVGVSAWLVWLLLASWRARRPTR